MRIEVLSGFQWHAVRYVLLGSRGRMEGEKDAIKMLSDAKMITNIETRNDYEPHCGWEFFISLSTTTTISMSHVECHAPSYNKNIILLTFALMIIIAEKEREKKKERTSRLTLYLGCVKIARAWLVCKDYPAHARETCNEVKWCFRKRLI